MRRMCFTDDMRRPLKAPCLGDHCPFLTYAYTVGGYHTVRILIIGGVMYPNVFGKAAWQVS